MAAETSSVTGVEVKLVDALGKETVVSEGEHTLGRGPLLKITDKRVSRTHALLKVEVGSVQICSKHKNPCYHKSSKEGKFVPITKDQWQEVLPGDKISLLPDCLVFTIMYDLMSTTSQKSPSPPLVLETARLTPTLPITDSSPALDDQMEAGTSSPSHDHHPTPQLLTEQRSQSPPVLETGQQTLLVDCSSDDLTKTDSTRNSQPLPQLQTTSAASSVGRTRRLPAWLVNSVSTSTATTSSRSKSSSSSSSRKRSNKTASKTTNEDSLPGDTVQDKPLSSKRRKVDNVVVGSVSKEASAEVDEGASCRDVHHSGDSVASGSTQQKNKNSQELEGAPAKKLPRCPYGKTCYRKNPVHFKEYSHDFDNDDEEEDEEEEDNRPECPYGTDCYRKNPAHKKQFKHTAPPSSVSRTSKRNTRKKKERKSVLAGDSDDDGDVNTYDYNDSFIDNELSGSSSSSYVGDSEDEDWSPGGGGGGRGGGGDDDEEDIDELVADAKSFMSNKKMQRPT